MWRLVRKKDLKKLVLETKRRETKRREVTKVEGLKTVWG